MTKHLQTRGIPEASGKCLLLRGSCFSTGSRVAKLGGVSGNPPGECQCPMLWFPGPPRASQLLGSLHPPVPHPVEREAAASAPALTSQPHCFLVMVLIAGTRGQQLPITFYNATHVTGQKAWSGPALGPHCAADRIWEGPVGSPLGRAGFLLSPPPSPLVPSPFASGGAAGFCHLV